MSNGIERRQFLKVLGASGAGAGLAACKGGPTGAEKLIPYVIPEEDIVPGVSTWYRTTCRECEAGCGISVATREGRAIKAEGNPLSPISRGKLCARGQASLHGLYDPDRIRTALTRGAGGWERIGWDDAEARLLAALNENRGRGVFLTHGTTGTMDRLLDAFCAEFGLERVRYEPFALEPIRAAHRLLFGQDMVPVHDFSNAEVVVTFGADFLETWISPNDYTQGFVRAHAYSQGRRGTLISVTPHQSLTDMNADEWLPIVPGTEHLVALALARIIVDGGAQAGGAAALLGTVDVGAYAGAAGVSPERLRQVAAVFANGGRSLAVGPGVASSHAAATQVAAAVAVLNSVAGNLGATVQFVEREHAASTAGSYADMQRLVARMAAGEVGALLVHGPNPVYSLPDGDAVRAALERVAFVASFSPLLDETAERATLLLPDHHFLESWGDHVPRTSTITLVQPVMLPVFDTKQTGDVLLAVGRRAGAGFAAEAATFQDYLRARWQREIHPAAGTDAPFDAWWRETLTVGSVTRPSTVGVAPAVSAEGLAAVGFQSRPADFGGPADAPHLVVYPSSRFFDGRLANRPWLQELPDPVSKFTWGSWVEVNPELADELGLDNGHIAEVETPRGTLRLPAWRHPGTRRDVIAIQLGQGHTALGTYAKDRGVNPIALLEPVAEDASGGLVWFQTRATLRNTGRWRRPTQAGLHSDQRGRGIAQAMKLEDAMAADLRRGLPVAGAVAAAPEPPDTGGYGPQHPMDAQVTQLQGTAGFRPERLDASPTGFPPPGTHYGEYSNAQPRWAMAIDLERCTGCSACITACYAENNIGIVGPEQVAKGRILQWMRLERYFEGEGEDLQTRFLPMLCQHCGTAPCEPVCPVYAAYHTPDGLNAQVYNRCVGTRYCANNCPYKVRVFNWFTWEWPEPLNWQLNPDVTVREKGVMEKCTFCVQRIRKAENEARLEERGVRDGDITPACAQTCPGEAIVFGNIRDPNARVTRVAASGRGYRVLDFLNTQSAVIYLRKISEHADEPAGGH
jgi:anaerobic selenocysteine-containing dehydrogenase/Fe-S-cluster-containing dehydrogenase component